jgi:hypothetical protein
MSKEGRKQSRRTRRHVGIHLDPGSTDGLELATLDTALDLVEEEGVVLLEPAPRREGREGQSTLSQVVLLRLTCDEAMLGVTIHQVELGGPGPVERARQLFGSLIVDEGRGR